MIGTSLTSMDLVRLADQMERDRELGWQELQSRDYAIGRRCAHKDVKQRLLCWLDTTEQANTNDRSASSLPLSESSLGLLISSGFFVLGVVTMAGFLFSHTQGLINVLWFFVFFVFLQFCLCLLSALTLLSVLTGNSSASFTLNPARLVYARALPDKRYLRDFQGIFQLIFMRYGQGMGIGFISGALAAFVLILAVNDFSFIWSSTFNLSNDAVLRFVNIASAPWADFVPAATVDAEVIADSRYHPTAGKFSPQQVLSMHSWWPFLLASMLCYVLLPRIVIWLLSRWLYGARLKQAFISYPGVDLLMQRMVQPAVHTQAPRHEHGNEVRAVPAVAREDVLLVSWGGAIAGEELQDYLELGVIAPEQMALAGLSLEGDKVALSMAASDKVSLVMLVVKSWEPPMSDLGDFIRELRPLASCVLFMKPLKGGAIDDNALLDWESFAAQLEDGELPIKPLSPSRPAPGPNSDHPLEDESGGA